MCRSVEPPACTGMRCATTVYGPSMGTTRARRCRHLTLRPCQSPACYAPLLFNPCTARVLPAWHAAQQVSPSGARHQLKCAPPCPAPRRSARHTTWPQRCGTARPTRTQQVGSGMVVTDAAVFSRSLQGVLAALVSTGRHFATSCAPAWVLLCQPADPHPLAQTCGRWAASCTSCSTSALTDRLLTFDCRCVGTGLHPARAVHAAPHIPQQPRAHGGGHQAEGEGSYSC